MLRIAVLKAKDHHPVAEVSLIIVRQDMHEHETPTIPTTKILDPSLISGDCLPVAEQSYQVVEVETELLIVETMCASQEISDERRIFIGRGAGRCRRCRGRRW